MANSWTHRAIHGTKYVHEKTTKFEKKHGFMDVKLTYGPTLGPATFHRPPLFRPGIALESSTRRCSTQGGTVCLFYVHESMTFFKFYGRFMDVFHGRITRDASMNSPLSIRKKESNLTTVFDFVKKMWRFPPPQTAILPLERLPGGWTSSSRRIAACG